MRTITDISKVIEQFAAYLGVQKGLQPNTQQCYCTDVQKLVGFCADIGVAVESVTPDHLHQFVCTLHDVGIHPRSQARIISGIKSLYQFLQMQGYIAADHTRPI